MEPDVKIYVWLKQETRFSNLKQGDVFSPIEMTPQMVAAVVNPQTLFVVDLKYPSSSDSVGFATRAIGNLTGVNI